MLTLYKSPTFGLGKLARIAKATLLSGIVFSGWEPGWSATQAPAANVEVDFEGRVLDAGGLGIAGAKVTLLETGLSVVAGADGGFSLRGTVAMGIIRRARLAGNLSLAYRNGVVSLEGAGKGGAEAWWISPGGERRRLTPISRSDDGRLRFDLDAISQSESESKPKSAGSSGSSGGVHWLLIRNGSGSAAFRFQRLAAGHGVLLRGASAGDMGSRALAKAGASSRATGDGFLLDVAASGFLSKRFAQPGAVRTGLSFTLLPGTASLKERIQDFLGAGNTFKLAFLKLESPASRKYILHYADFGEMAGDTLPQHAFPDSRGPANSPYGASAPAWSPDGRTLAYETGWENLTTPISRVYIQPLAGARIDGPAYPATNPRWWTDGKDTSLIWCGSGKQDAWSDTATATYRQKVVKDSLAGNPELLARGSFNAGLSPDGKYLATAYRFALMLDIQAGTRKFLHVYPGHSSAAEGASADSLQACNGSVSQDPLHPSRMLFLDFGVPDEPAYPNLVTPKLYAQHRMILIGDYASDAPGGIVDFIDTPAEELGKANTWDDPEWTNHADFVVATTRDPDGDKTVPAEPAPTQPDIYLIKLSTKESIKVFSGTNQVMPAAWIGPKN